MRTELSWTEFRRALTDLRSLLAFRSSGLTNLLRKRLRIGMAIVIGLTLTAIIAPAYAKDAFGGERVGTFVALLPSFYLGFLGLAILSAAASGGGRELIPREQAVAFPVSTLTDHLGALLMAPLNIAWLIQSWAMLGMTSYVLGPTNLWASAIPILLWMFTSTALAQIIGWLLEWVRRGPFGIWTARAIVAVAIGGLGVLIITDNITAALDRSPTVDIYLAAAFGTGGAWQLWATYSLVIAGIGVLAVLVGAVPARMALHRAQREELRLESGQHEARGNPASDLIAMIRIDRAAIWRSVPLRRGLLVLALMPGMVAFAGKLEWSMLTILPGLVASGGALLFGVNAWCLDGRGALWRDSLPASPGLGFLSRVVVLTEVLIASASVTLVLGALRAGIPTTAELVALICATLVVSVQVVATSMRWSVNRPFAVDMRSARATPAPPVVMAGYSARLALGTTFAGLVFSGLATVDNWVWSVLFALPMLFWSSYRLARTATQWEIPTMRAAVIATVAS